MDDWRTKLAKELIAETPAREAPEAAVAMEVSFGEARSAINYALGIAHAHRFRVTGRVDGDDVWIRLGDGQVRVTLNRRRAEITLDVHRLPQGPQGVPRHEEKRLHWRDGSLTDGTSRVDLGELTRASIDVLVQDWRSQPASAKRLSSAPPRVPDVEVEDEPTKT
jgi:hypothetical protein